TWPALSPWERTISSSPCGTAACTRAPPPQAWRWHRQTSTDPAWQRDPARRRPLSREPQTHLACANTHAPDLLTCGRRLLQSNAYATDEHCPAHAPGCHPVEPRRASVPRLEPPLRRTRDRPFTRLAVLPRALPGAGPDHGDTTASTVQRGPRQQRFARRRDQRACARSLPRWAPPLVAR